MLDLNFLAAFDADLDSVPNPDEDWDDISDQAHDSKMDDSMLKGSVRAMIAKDFMNSKKLDDALHVMGIDERLRTESQKAASTPSKPKQARTTPMTAEEKLELSRERNRENAKATRRRRKLYVQMLQQLIAELTSNITAMQEAEAKKQKEEKAKTGNEVANSSSTNAGEGQERGKKKEMPKVSLLQRINGARSAVVNKFFELRSEGATSREEWGKLIANAETFVLTLPPLPFRKYDDFEKSGQFYRCRGVDGLVADTAVLQTTMSRIAATRAKVPPKARCVCKALYSVDAKDMLLGMDKLMCKWKGVYSFDFDGKELKIQIFGMCKCRFTMENLLASVDLRYDVQGLISQLEAALPTPSFPIMPMAMPVFSAKKSAAATSVSRTKVSMPPRPIAVAPGAKAANVIGSSKAGTFGESRS